MFRVLGVLVNLEKLDLILAWRLGSINMKADYYHMQRR